MTMYTEHNHPDIRKLEEMLMYQVIGYIPKDAKISVMSDREQVERLKKYVKVKYRAENLQNSNVKALLDHFGVIGLPTYVVLTPKKNGD